MKSIETLKGTIDQPATWIALILMIIFLLISGIHFYWGFGGKWAKDSVIPTREDGIKVFVPGAVPTFIVALVFLGFGFVVFLSVAEPDFKLPFRNSIIHKYGLWIIAGIFIVRAIGEFNYVGFFKKHKQSKFGKNDTRYYSPLCMITGLLALFLALSI